MIYEFINSIFIFILIQELNDLLKRLSYFVSFF